jgi:hypothetical protein
MTVDPRHVICVLGKWKRFDAVEKVLEGTGCTLDTEYSQLEPDDRMPRAFDASADRVEPSISKHDEAAIAKHTAVAYVLSPRLPRAEAMHTSARVLRVIGALLDAGGLAVKCESAGIAHGAERWRELAKRLSRKSLLDRATALRLAFVRRPIGDDDVLYSCGMHLLGERDVEVAPSGDVFEDIAWMDLLATYVLAETPERGIKAGEGFRREEGGERRVLRAKKCTRYEEDDFHYNPYGYWRLT